MNTYSTIAVTGPDSFEFLQGQLSNDLKLLDATESLLSAWCNPKGRVICLLTVTTIADGYGLKLPTELSEDVLRRLTMFRFRSKVDFAISDATASEDPMLGIEKGVAWIGADQSEKFTPHMLNLDLLNAINLEKGCYTGQEIVARTHYKGATKRRTLRFQSEGTIAVGDDLLADEKKIGEILNVVGNNCLAVVTAEKVRGALSAAGSPLQKVPLPYG